MSRRQSPARELRREKPPRDPNAPIPAGEYFSAENRDLVVRRGELFGALEWNFRNTIERNRWWRRLLRWLFRRQPVTYDPWRLSRLAQAKAEMQAQEEA